MARRRSAAPTRSVGLEILEGIRELKRGEHGRVISVPSVGGVREKTGLSQARFAELLAGRGESPHGLLAARGGLG